MTNFYTYEYLTRQPNKVNTIILGISFVLIIGAVVFLGLFLRHRDDGKYRELTIIMILGLLLTVTIQYNQWSNNRNILAHNGQVANLIKQVASKYQLSPSQIYSNSTDLKNGMLLRLKNKIYEVDLNSDNSSFKLERVQLTNPEIKIIRK
ncbi:DUF3290 domain-containing protein [Lactobacillus sp. DCY120]|uniref:DUF3290 domain-containing protein n=1 Tax=Bombilactobacillus apium TaxID=2675299 RepID=A0A850QYA5_9LACO|nr:DUF3290 domain-containing protein [Bombilactobacillus apium]NVY95689.1 DUF3290 domain-containing protein [Bombilactobacillus apium]